MLNLNDSLQIRFLSDKHTLGNNRLLLEFDFFFLDRLHSIRVRRNRKAVCYTVLRYEHWIRVSLGLPPHLVHQLALMSILLLDLLHLLVDLLAALGVVPVVEEHSTSILNDLELRAHNGEAGLDEPVLV
jgi:hypothetical protein